MSGRAISTSTPGGGAPMERAGNATIAEIGSWHARIEQATDADLLTVYRLAGEIGKRAWVIQAHCLAVAKKRKLHHNDGGVRAVADMFGLSPSQASGLIKVWETWGVEFLERDAPSDRIIGVSWYKTAAYTDDPKLWLEHIERRRAQNAAYRVEDLRLEISEAERRGNTGPPVEEDRALVRATAGADGDPPRQIREVVEAEYRVGPARWAPGDPPAGGGGGEPPDAAAALVAQYHRLIRDLERAAVDTAALVHKTDPREMARLLGPIGEDEQFNYRVIDILASWVRRVAQARRLIPAPAKG